MFMVCGEALLDVFSAGSTSTGISFDGRIGGFNFQWAWASAFVAGSAAGRG